MDIITIILAVGSVLLFISACFTWAALQGQKVKHDYDVQNLRAGASENRDHYWKLRHRLEALEAELHLEYQDTRTTGYIHKD